MFSSSHFRNFLSDDQVRKQSAMSKRGQEATSNQGSRMAKARPCLVARDPFKLLHKVWGIWSIRGILMKEKKWK